MLQVVFLSERNRLQDLGIKPCRIQTSRLKVETRGCRVDVERIKLQILPCTVELKRVDGN